MNTNKLPSTEKADHLSYKRHVRSAFTSKWLLAIGILAVAAVIAIVFAAAVGPVSVPFSTTMTLLLEKLQLPVQTVIEDRERLIVEQVRLPRVIVGGLVGAALAISGAAMQGLFRNPLVEPGYVGVSSGAAVGAVCALFFGWTQFGKWMLPISAFVGAIVSVILILLIWRGSRKSSITTLLLLGIGINALLSAIINIMVASSNSEQELRSIVFWLQGGLEARTWEHVQLIGPPIVLGCALICIFGRDLNLMLLGDEQAEGSGIRVRGTRYMILGLASLMTGSAVAVSGIIGFVGLVVPHVVRLIAGPDHRLLLPASALGGASFLIVADVISRMILQPVTLQVGVVSACIGAPLFISLVLRSRKVNLG
ncbi:iron ABC transporter permease [Paenibacillus sp. J2TS4]|uniref:FecCD family ABC transporter permease n=1 Tax=Paenibacillus sp. J2TS4 TaxID=2807194 RepID=UPI001AFF4FBF|nr:iron ABC transporter permease [Paenibacillus sp. J2TS4]GIP31531.1 ABC transporter permease [Paenibacillus sp. J2TS4]